MERPVDWVPVEQRFLGMDRKSLIPAIVVAVFAAIAFWGVPALNAATTVDDPVRAGDVIQLGTAVTFAPAVGWNIESGLRQGAAGVMGNPESAQLTHDGVSFGVVSDTFDGTPAELLAQIKRTNDKLHSAAAITVDGDAKTFTTSGGQHGVISKFSSGSGIGLIAAFVFDGVGVEVTAFGPTSIDADTQSDIVAMLESVRPLDAAADGSTK